MKRDTIFQYSSWSCQMFYEKMCHENMFMLDMRDQISNLRPVIFLRC
uniref:Uncharacterized protein n=1 Tax=Arundo donax TaxID=35708 RepID=A0A0A9FGE3_ARUDO